ncbi:glycoside hydrolase family 35 protein [Enterococcus sp. LJL128]
MTTFEIKDEFYLNGAPFKIISGSIHYFRVVPEYWQDRLEKLKALGCNTVETYVPWNLHEPDEGKYCFEGQLDLRKFIQTAADLGLYVIVRPAPYICAEWEFGGLPYWLLKDAGLKLRFDNPEFIEKVDRYFSQLFLVIGDLQISSDGPIILFQVENEYGGYANDKTYLKKMIKLMKEKNVTVPLVTSDGPWGDMLENGSVQSEALPTINCGSKVKEHFKRLRAFHEKKRPLMVMEFWIGWFDAWGDKQHHTTDAELAAAELNDILAEGSVNIYMFHGGTNFAFTNGANYYEKLAPDVTSYDYDALLTEWGEITPKYRAFQQVIANYTEIPKLELSQKISRIHYGMFQVEAKTSLIANLACLAEKKTHNYPLSMEELDQGFGYVFYQSSIGKARTVEDFRLIGCMDRAHIFVNNQLQAIQYDQELGESLSFELAEPVNDLGILVENMGRVNYSVKMNHQKKGISDGVVINGAFQSEWSMYRLPMDNLEQLDFALAWQAGQPAFYRVQVMIEKIGDTFIDLTGWGKGFVVVNGFNIGRYWEIGPQKRLYIPGPLLKKGQNELIIFESEGKAGNQILLTDTPDLGKTECKKC